MENYQGVEYLRQKLAKKRVRADIRYKRYEMKEPEQKRSLLIPSWLKGEYKSTVGWIANSVDTLADRLVFDGFTDESDFYGANGIFDMNNPDIFFDSAIREALIGSCSFVHIVHGEGNEKIPRLSVLTCMDATGIMEEQSGLLKEGYAVLDRDKNKNPILEAYFTRESTTYYQKGAVVQIEQNPARYPLLVPVVYKPSSKRPFGHSRISRSCMYYQDFAKNTLERAEVSAEFYSFPQKYVTGLDPESDPLDSWKASMSAMLSFDKDQDGDRPTVGQFTQQSMAPYTDQLKMVASMFSGETGLTLDDLGFPTDVPSSAEAIKASHEQLRVIARKAQRNFTTAFANVGYIAASLRDGEPYARDMISTLKPVWAPVFEPDASMLSTVGDGAIKINQAVPNFFTKDNLQILTGIEASGEEPVDVQEETEA